MQFTSKWNLTLFTVATAASPRVDEKKDALENNARSDLTVGARAAAAADCGLRTASDGVHPA